MIETDEVNVKYLLNKKPHYLVLKGRGKRFSVMRLIFWK